MLQFQKSLTIHAPVEQVFDYIADWSLMTTIWPSLVVIRDLEHLPHGGSAFRYAYKMAGRHLEGRGEDTEYVANERLVTRITGGLQGTITFRFKPIGHDTQVDFEFAYTAPPALLRRVSEAFVARLNEQEAELVLQNLQTHFEVAIAAPIAR